MISSGTLVRAMLADGLVDELHLCVYPLTRGSGPRMFTEDAAPGNLSLAAGESYETGCFSLAYRIAVVGPRVSTIDRGVPALAGVTPGVV